MQHGEIITKYGAHVINTNTVQSYNRKFGTDQIDLYLTNPLAGVVCKFDVHFIGPLLHVGLYTYCPMHC